MFHVVSIWFSIIGRYVSMICLHAVQLLAIMMIPKVKWEEDNEKNNTNRTNDITGTNTYSGVKQY